MQQWYKCPKCGKDILYGTTTCSYCKSSLAWSESIPYTPRIEAPQQQVTQPSANPPTQKIPSKWLYLGTPIIAFVAWFIAWLFFPGFFMNIFYLYAFIIFVILLYKAWRIFPNVWPRALPLMAAGFLFIPIFNCFWSFHVIWGFANDYNAYIAEDNAIKYKMNAPLFLCFCIFTFISPISFFLRGLSSPEFKIFIVLATATQWVLLLIMINQMRNAIYVISNMACSDKV